MDVRITSILDEEYVIVKRVSLERRKENAKKVGKTDGIGDLVFGRGRIIPFRAAGAGTGRPYRQMIGSAFAGAAEGGVYRASLTVERLEEIGRPLPEK